MENSSTSTSSVARPLAGKVAVVTGASRGIGAAAAAALARAGAAVAVAARDSEALGRVAADIEASGGSALAVPTDVTDSGAVERLIASTIDSFGGLDLAFNNAGAGHMPTTLADMTLEDFDRSLAVNLRSAFISLKHEIAAMASSGGGTIVNMSSAAGLRAGRGMGAYAAAKRGVIALTQAAALDYAQQGIRVNALAPGPILNERLIAAGEHAREQAASWTPLRRLGRPEEIADLVVWLCSPQTAYMTGAVIAVDGGLTL